MRVSKRQYDALKESRDKWQDIVDGTGQDAGRANCACCKLYIDNRCMGCPIAKKTGIGGCVGTPYGKWSVYVRDSGRNKVLDERSKELAQAELKFLQDLLDECVVTKTKTTQKETER